MTRPSTHDKQRELADGILIVYLATRLFDLSEKISTSKLETAVFDGLMKGFEFIGMIPRCYPIFMPYRDLKEDELLHKENMFKMIYDDDIKRLDKLYGMISYINDPSKDDGVCMELGYAFARRVPIICFSTDIQTYRPKGISKLQYIVDPILHRITGHLFHYYKLPPTDNHCVDDIHKMRDFANEYEARLQLSEEVVLSTAQKLAEALIVTPHDYINSLPAYIEGEGIFIDLIGNRDEWALYFSTLILAKLQYLNVPITFGRRFDIQHLRDSDFGTPAEVGEEDIRNMLQARLVVICVDGPEADSGASVLVGIAKALKKKVILYYSGSVEILEGVDTCSRNLMIEYSAEIITTTIDDTIHILKNMY